MTANTLRLLGEVGRMQSFIDRTPLLSRDDDECDTEKVSAPPHFLLPRESFHRRQTSNGSDACRSAEDVVRATGQQPLGFEEIAQALRPKLHR
jgi:hypothetical protein